MIVEADRRGTRVGLHPHASLTYLLQKVAKRGLELLEAELDDLDLTTRQFLLLALVATGDDLSQQDVAARLGLDPTAVVKLVDQLEARGLVERARSTTDRRQHRLALTTTGNDVRREAVVRQQRAEKELTRAIGARRTELHALLEETFPGRV